MAPRAERWRTEMVGAALMYLAVADALADRYGYRRSANDFAPGLEGALLAALFLPAAFIQSFVVAAKRKGILW